MLFDRDSLKALGLTNAQIATLEQRQRGGEAGDQGYEYQRRFALTAMLEHAAIDLGTCVSMEALCPVDDVIIERRSRHEHAQCKTSDQVTWTASGAKLRKEFLLQEKLLEDAGVTDFQLKLVVPSNRRAAILRRALPKRLAKTVVEHFPHAAPRHQPWNQQRLKAALDARLPPVLRGPSSREALYKSIDHEARRPWGGRTALAVLRGAARKSPDLPMFTTGLGLQWSVSQAKWSRAMALLQRIPDLKIVTDGGVCCYEVGPMESGRVARCDTVQFEKFVENVLVRQPATVDEFLEVRP